MPPQIVLVIQFRPPVRRYCIEFPSGFIDDNETVETAALRELHEETGYYGKIKRISEPICYEPGLTDSLTKVVDVEVIYLSCYGNFLNLISFFFFAI
jgi:ADP-ribose pyrophosphatase